MMDGGMMDGGMMSGMWALGALWFLVGLVLVALMVAAIVWLVHSMQGSGGTSMSEHEARSELDRRYAAGDLDRDEYLQRRQDLEQRV